MDVPVLWSIVQADLNEPALESEAGWDSTHVDGVPPGTCPV